MVKVAPCPCSLSTTTSPPDCLVKPNTWLSPSPVPSPDTLRRKKWLEDLVDRPRQNTTTGISHGDGDEVARHSRMGANRRHAIHPARLI